MKRVPLRIGVSVRLMYPDPSRSILAGKTIEYAESSIPRWIASGGALPFLIPHGDITLSSPTGSTGLGSGNLQGFRESSHGRVLAAYAQHLDGLVLQGGTDLAPESYCEKPRRAAWKGDPIRDRYEFALVSAFLAAGKPILGICRGCQLLNVAFGGTLHQDIPSHRVEALYDRHKHRVKILPGSRLAKLYPAAAKRPGVINSIHHQSIKELGKDLIVEAVSPPDGIIEAIRLKGPRYVVGIQWHPEFIPPRSRGLLPREPLLKEFLAACSPHENL